jgi:hypothetical protein
MLRPIRAASMGAHTRNSILPASHRARLATSSRAGIGLAFVLALAACAGTGATPSPTPSPTPTPTVSPTPGTVSVSPAAQAYLVPLDGYEYVVLPAAVEQQMAAGFAANPAVVSVIKGYAASSVTKGGEAQAVVLVLDANASFAALPGTMDQFWTGVASSSGTEVKAGTIAGQEVKSVDGAASKLVGWHDSNLIILVFGAEMAPTNAVAEALIRAHA